MVIEANNRTQANTTDKLAIQMNSEDYVDASATKGAREITF